jgi:hypothetical protein
MVVVEGIVLRILLLGEVTEPRAARGVVPHLDGVVLGGGGEVLIDPPRVSTVMPISLAVEWMSTPMMADQVASV